MRLYHLTTTPPLSGTALVSGSFTGSKKQEIVVASGTHLHLYRRLKSGVLHPAISVPVFASIRSLGVFRLPGTSRDYLAVTSDSGSVTVLQADGARATFVSVANETFGRTGMRRTIPGEFLACDPQGRALMVAAVERQKFVYVLARDESNTLQLSSPLEAHKSNNATHAIAALDVGYENPMFAALEMAYEADASKLLVYYELDLGLNHVVRKLSAPVNYEAYLLIAVPGDEVGPGGVLLCESGSVSYRNLSEEDEHGNLLPRNEHDNDSDMDLQNGSSTTRPKRIRAKLPHRKNDAEYEQRMVVSAALIKHKNKKGTVFFFMLCTDIGDLIRLELLWDPEIGATEMRLAYFDTLPAPARDIRILRSGYLFALMEGGDSLFLKFVRSDVPENDPNGGFSTSLAIDDDSMDDADESNIISFTVRDALTYLSHAENVPSFAPVLGMHSGDFTGEGASQQVMACGRGAGGAALRVVRRGLLVEDRMSTLTLTAAANGAFSFREKYSGEPAHKFLVISFATKTMILLVENGALTEVTDSFGFRKDASTLYAVQMGRDSFVQVHTNGVRYVPGAKSAADTNSEWTPPDGTRIVAATANNAQVLAALSNGDVMYFEMNESGALAPRDRLEGILAIGGEDEDTNIGAGDKEARPSLALSHVPEGRKQSQFFVVGDGANQKVMVYKLDLKGNPQRVALHLAPAPISSLALVDFGEVDRGVLEATSGSKSSNSVVPHPPYLMLFIGTKHGALVRLVVDYTTGSLGEKRSTFLGPAPITVTAMRMIGVPTCLVMAAKPWLFFPRGGSVTCSPLCSEAFQFATPFDTTDIPGFIAVTSNRLRMLCLPAIEHIATVAGLPTDVTPAASPALSTLNTTSVMAKSKLDATPRRLISLFSNPRGAGGIGMAPRLGATGVDPANIGNTNSTTAEDRKGMDLFVVVETDHRAEFTNLEAANGKESSTNSGTKKVPKRARVVPSKEGRWASQIRLVSVQNLDDDDDDKKTDEFEGELEAMRTLDVSRLQPDECALCAAASRTMGGSETNPNVSHVVVSVCRNLKVNATERTGGNNGMDTVENELWTYRVDNKTRKLELLHKTDLEGGYENSVHAITAFRDVMVVGIGNGIRIYQIGKKRLLRKGELRAAVRRKVAALCTAGGDRIFIGDVQHSVTICDYTPTNNNSVTGGATGTASQLLSVVARDSLPRWTTSMCVVDYKTVCLGDKFGNICLLRLDSDDDNGLSVMACMHVGGTVTGVFFDGAMVRYATAHGAIGALVALESESEHTLVRQVERYYTPSYPSLLRRDHTAWRSTFYPVKNVVDGEVCEGVLRERGKDKDAIEKAIGRPLMDVVRVMDELRWKIEAL